jgi:hypothetical protein
MNNHDLSRFNAKYVVDPDTGCWVWHAAKRGGYGAFSIKGKMTGAHQVSYEAVNGPVPAGLELDHLCRNRACVNPGHLEPVTSSENKRRSPLVRRHMLERARRGRSVARANDAARPTCKNGHARTPANIYVSPDGYRRCRACNQAACRRYKTDRRMAELRPEKQ